MSETKQNELIKLEIDPTEYGLEKHEAEQIQSVFVPVIDMLKKHEDDYNMIVSLPMSPEKTKKARELRLKLMKVRTGTADIHKKAKAYYLAGGRAVDGLKNTVTFAITGKEEVLEGIEKHYENLEKERIAKLQEERVAAVLPYGVDGSLMNLGTMSDDVWNNYFTGVKLAHQAKIDAEIKAEEERIAKEKAEAEERERIRLENERLKKEAEEREAQMKAEREAAERKLAEERAKAEEERRAIEEKARKEREALEEKARAEREAREKVLAEERAKQEAERAKAEHERLRAEAEQAAKLKAEREEREKAEAELKAKYEAEEKQRKEEEKARKKAMNAPDKTKLLTFSKNLRDLELPSLKTDDTRDILQQAQQMLREVSDFIDEQASGL